MLKMFSSFFKESTGVIVLLIIVAGCVRDVVPQSPGEELHEVVFHAGWASETKTVLQEDGSVWWSPGDEISLFVGDGKSDGGYVMHSTNDVAAPTTDFIGDIGDGNMFSAIYPYDKQNYYDSGRFGVYFSDIQTAQDGTFAKDSFKSIAQSTDNNLFFKNVCGGIKISIANDGITQIKLSVLDNDVIAGLLEYVIDENATPIMTKKVMGFADLLVYAPNGEAFEPNKNYYIVLPNITFQDGLKITFYRNISSTEYEYAYWTCSEPVEISRSTFKRLIRIDEGLRFHKDAFGNAATLYSFLPDDIGKESITDIEFHVNNATMTDNQLSASVPVYYEKSGTKVNIYTKAELFDISEITGNMFNQFLSLKKIDLSNTVTPRAMSFFGMFNKCISLESIVFGDWDTFNVNTIERMFSGCEKLHSLDLSFMDTENIENMREAFADCNVLTSLNISSFNTSKTTNMGSLFAGCKGLTSLDVSQFDTKSVTNMSGMFSECQMLEYLDLSNFNTERVIDMSEMFYNCSSLRTIDLSSFNTLNVTGMKLMFYGCSEIESLDLSHFKTPNCKNMYFMFGWCTLLKDLNIKSFTSESLDTAELMFVACRRLQKLNMGAFDISAANCNRIGQGLMATSKGGAIRCVPETKAKLEVTLDENVTRKVTWMDLVDDINTFEYQRNPGLYYSSDYSKHKTVKKLFSATEGNGIDIVIMGDAYSDRLIKNGQYDADMKLAADAVFAKEPFASFKDFFNVYILYLVSDNEILGESTALNGLDSGTGVLDGYATCSVPNNYRVLATGNADLSISDAIVVINGTKRVTGYTNMVVQNFDVNYYDCDYGRGLSSVCVGRGDASLSDEFNITVAHEFGHSFAKLADEYYDQSVSDTTEAYNLAGNHSNSAFTRFGWYKNIDLTSDPGSIRWARFLNDERYAEDGVGVFEGGFKSSTGVWRPSYNSIMRYGTEFNAPSRVAIYNRIHKLAYGKQWQFDFESFVKWDMKNIGLEKRALKANIKECHPHLNNIPFVEMNETINKEGKCEINIIMN